MWKGLHSNEVGFAFVLKEMATHSNILAWSIPWTEEPGSLQSMGSQDTIATKTTITIEDD